jgi:hypothetical protein
MSPLSEDVRYRLIAENPVAGARFFHFMVEMFIKHVLGVNTAHDGLYGNTSGYYGTVEQQGRLTLHLHMLVWITGTLPPEEMRLKILEPDSEFRKSLIEYLENAHSGDFMTGVQEEVEEYLENKMTEAGYQDPTTTLPIAPPTMTCIPGVCKCEKCIILDNWWMAFRQTVDDLLFKSNTHRCTTNRHKDGSKNKARSFTGCLDNVFGKCKARFPRPVVETTHIDEETGHIHLKKKAQWINTFSYLVMYLFRCNTDVTSLKSGTAIKGVLLYVTNYLTKPTLKTHVIFDTIRSVFQKNAEIVGGSESRQQIARKLMTKIVNSLSVKMEHGAPMINMYLLQNPDHYCSHNFRNCYWQAFVTTARSSWVANIPTDQDVKKGENATQVAVLKQGKRVVGLSLVLDYIW